MLHYFAGLQHCNEVEVSDDQGEDQVDHGPPQDNVAATFEAFN